MEVRWFRQEKVRARSGREAAGQAKQGQFQEAAGR